ncbi:ABC transporter ATP-binding protein [Chloroflexota bacterium]
MQKNQKPMIIVKKLSRSLSFGERKIDILKGLSFDIGPGQWVALMGPSGSGKSTLLGLLAGIDTPTSGRLALDGIEITHMHESRLARLRNQKIGIVFQSFHLIPSLTAQENVETPLYIGPQAHKARALAGQMLDMVGLGDRRDHRPHQLSGGEQQRVAIARALVTRPKLLLADEPTGNLDSLTSQRVLALFALLRREFNLTMVMATHDTEVANAADSELYLKDGELVNPPGNNNRPAELVKFGELLGEVAS